MLQSITPNIATRYAGRGGLTRRVLQEAVPEFYEMQERIEALVAAAATIPPPDTGANAMSGVLSALAEGAMPSGADLVAFVAGDVEALARWNRAHEVLTAALNTCKRQQDDALLAARDRIVGALDKAAKETMSALRGHPLTKKGATTAEAAISAGLSDQWADYQRLRATYMEVHAVLRDFAASGIADLEIGVLDSHAVMEHVPFPDAIWPLYTAWKRFGPNRQTTDGNHIGRPPWPDPKEPAFVTWLIANPSVEVWIPTSAQLADARQRILRAQQDLPAEGLIDPAPKPGSDRIGAGEDALRKSGPPCIIHHR